jgi:hypothetical protein
VLSPTHARPVLTATLNCSQVTAALFTSSPRDHVFDFVTADVQTFFFVVVATCEKQMFKRWHTNQHGKQEHFPVFGVEWDRSATRWRERLHF